MAIATYAQAARPLTVTTPLGKDALLLVGFSGREDLSHLFSFQLDLVAENRSEVPFDKLMGQKVGVEIVLPGGGKRHFNGIVKSFRQGRRDFTFTYYRAEIVPQLWLWTKKVQSRIFQHLSVPEILKKVLDGLDVVYEIQGQFHPRNFCVQYRESDFAFASRLMEEEGVYYFFKHTASGHQMVVANTPQGHPETPAPSNVIYDEIEGGGRPERRVTAWEKSQELRAGKCTFRDHCFEMPEKNLEATKSIQEGVQVGRVAHKLKLAGGEQFELYDYPGGYAQRFDGIDRGGAERQADLQKIFDDGRRTAEIRMQQEAADAVRILGESNCGQFVAGHKFTLERHFDADGPYVLTSVEHVANQGNYQSGNGKGFRYENKFTCVPAGLPYRPARSTSPPIMPGPQTATVVGPPGETIFCDKYGRVKVQFHWDRQGKKDADSSCWIRVSSVGAGKGFGFVNLPRVGQEVIVDFIEGDPDRPIITGAVYNAEDMPPRKLPECRTQFGIRGFNV
jgi:type VI secretion system secreted protein VgrG